MAKQLVVKFIVLSGISLALSIIGFDMTPSGFGQFSMVASFATTITMFLIFLRMAGFEDIKSEE